MRRPLLKDLSLQLDNEENQNVAALRTAKNSDNAKNWSLKAICIVLLFAVFGTVMYCMKLIDLNQGYVQVFIDIMQH